MVELPKTERIILELSNNWLTISFNHPETRNSLSQQLTDEIILSLESVRNESSIRGITFRGEGGVFCSGGDLKSFKFGLQGGDKDLSDVERMSEKTGEFFELINSFPKPTIMLAEGAAMAGGLGMLCAADIVVVTSDCKFALTETTLGIVPAQIAPLIVSRVGLSKARRLMLTASRFHGKEAGKYGIADFVTDNSNELRTVESEIKKNIYKCAPGANSITKEIVLATRKLEGDVLRKFAAKGFAKAMMSDEGKEGITAFVEKRKPKWSE